MKTNTDPHTKITDFQFQSIETDPERIFQKVKFRIQSGYPLQIGVHPAWKYISAASVLLLLTLSSFYFLTPTGKQMEISSPYVEMSTLNNSKAKIVLPDQSEVWLNNEAKISYPSTFFPWDRNIFLTGEAVFIIQKDSLSPFTIHTKGMRIEVLGTTFYVDAKEEKATIETILVEGKIALYKENNHTNIPDITLLPDQQAIFHKSNGQIEVQPVMASLYTSWTDNTFLFENTSLSEITAALERAYGVKIQIQNSQLKNIKLTARFQHNESLEEILSVLQISGRYEWIKQKDGTICIQ